MPEPVDLVGGPIWCFPWPAACLVYLFSMFVSAMAQPVLTLGHLRGEPRKSQKNGLFLRCRQPGWETGFRPGLFPSALGNQRDSGGPSWALVFPGPWYGKIGKCNHKITGSHFLHRWLHSKPQLPPTEFKPQPDPLDQPGVEVLGSAPVLPLCLQQPPSLCL